MDLAACGVLDVAWRGHLPRICVILQAKEGRQTSVFSRGVAPPAAHACRSSRSHAGSNDDDDLLPRDVPASLSTPCEERTVTGV